MLARNRVAAGILAALALGLASEASAQLSQQEERGRAIYFGLAGSALEDATATIAGSGVTLPARSFACSSCHGERGLGREERGVIPSDIRRSSLSKSYGLRTKYGRTRPGYDLAAFRKTLATGVDTGGAELDEAMPRFAMPAGAAEDLWAYLSRLDQIHEPGLTDTSIRLATALPLSGPNAPEGRAMQDVMQKLVDEANGAGGAHGRKLVLAVHDSSKGRLREGDALLWVAPYNLPDAEAADASTPVIAPLPSAGNDDDGNGYYVVHLTAGDSEQTDVLKRYASSRLGVKTLTECKTRGGDAILLLNQGCPDLDLGREVTLMTLAAYQSRSEVTRPAPGARVFVATPIDPRLISEAAQRRFAAVRSRVYVQRPTLLAEAHAFSAMTLTVELLRRSGRDISRAVVLDTLGKLRNFVGTMTPPLSYSRTNHVGSHGAYIVELDTATGRLSSDGDWVEP